MINVKTSSVEETKKLAIAIGASLKGGEVFELVSDLGGGKTTFVKGLAKGLGVHEVVQSPTFNICRIYDGHDGLELHHFDFYRLSQPGVIADELSESLAESNIIIAIEWGEVVHDVLPKERIAIKITSVSDDERDIEFRIPKKYKNITEALLLYKKQRNLL
ncbi:MAG: tRNA (adenosine(37)-N6)-threonylcarbamoyltransferase complex ATPase subunit type 1 TsaE [Candidatus Woesebacteria bacterium]